MSSFVLNTSRLPILIILLLLTGFGGGCNPGERVKKAEPISFMLSWQNDPTSTMTIDWYPVIYRSSYLEYRKLGDEQWQMGEGRFIEIPETGRHLLRLELTGLQPDQLYEFRFTGEDPVYKFRTMPDQHDRPIRFVAGGDMLHTTEWMRNTAMSVMRTMRAEMSSQGLDFAVIGGDLAYTDGEARKVGRWYDYFRIWSEVMVTSEGRVIPHLAAIGNHEVKRAYIHNYPFQEYNHPDFRIREAPYFSTFIPFPGEEGYGVLDFGDYLSLFLLDSGHTSFVDGPQAEWLERALYERRHVRHLIPVYHVTAWPSARKMTGEIETLIRETWVPLFEEYGVRLTFENHDHTYKRTHPIRNHQVDETGIYYIGDGAWGVRTRPIRVDEDGNPPWYIANADSLRHFILGELDGDQIRLRMYDEDGRPIDQLDIEPVR